MTEEMAQQSVEADETGETNDQFSDQGQEKKGGIKILVGILFILPALVVTVVVRLIPGFRTIWLSFQDARFTGEAEIIGLANYAQMAEGPLFSQALGFTLLLTLFRLMTVIIPPLFLTLGTHGLKKGERIGVRLLASLPWMVYSPMALALGWFFLLNPQFGLFGRAISIADPNSIRWLVIGLDSLAFFGLATGFGLTIYLAGLRKKSSSGRMYRNLLILLALMIVGTVALSLQTGQSIFVFTQGGPMNTTTTLLILLFRQLFAQMRLGSAAAIASPLLIIVGVLGVAVCLIALLSNLRIVPRQKSEERTVLPKWLRIVGGVLMVFTLVGILLTLIPNLFKFVALFRAPGGGVLADMRQVLGTIGLSRILLNTWLKPLIFVLGVQFPVTYLAAVGIGVVRPFGRGSDWLLLLFAPWLFVSVTLLLPGLTKTIMNMGLFNTVFGLGFPFLINIPMLFILTAFFKRTNAKSTGGNSIGSFFRELFIPSLPLTALCLVGGLLSIQQNLLWIQAVVNQSDQFTMPMMLFRLMTGFSSSWQGFISLLLLLRTPAFFLSLLLLGAYQVFYFPQVSIEFGKQGE